MPTHIGDHARDADVTELVLFILQSSRFSMSAPDIARAARKAKAGIDLAEVYRAISRLRKVGLVEPATIRSNREVAIAIRHIRDIAERLGAISVSNRKKLASFKALRFRVS